MRPNQPDPLLRALFDDDAWRDSCRETQARAGSRLRRRRCWRKLRVGLAAVVIAAAVGWWFADHAARVERSGVNLAGHAPAAEELHLQLALNLPVTADGPLTVRAYDPLPEWTFHCEPLADSSGITPAGLLRSTLSNDLERELH
jgi:hypothetical protein